MFYRVILTSVRAFESVDEVLVRVSVFQTALIRLRYASLLG